jgi:hypothetical protein
MKKKVSWTKVGHRIEMSLDGSVWRQEFDLADFVGTEVLAMKYGIKQFHFDDKYWYFCKDSYLIKMLEEILQSRIF